MSSIRFQHLALSVLFTALSFATLSVPADNFLWKATSKQGELYIQGSSHVLKAENYPLAPAIEQAYSNSTTLVFEVDMGEMMSPKTQQLIMGLAMLKEPDTLKSVLDPETYANLESEAVSVGLPLAAIEKFKPWFATMTLTLVSMKKMGLDEKYGLDKYFYDKAKADKKSVIGLETVDFQISLLDSLSDENPNDFVNRSLSELNQIEEDLQKLLTAWETGDVQTMENLILKSFQDYPEQFQRFIVERNKAWVQKIGQMTARDQTPMIVVGAAHLPGDEGVINLLRKQGFTIEQL